jgi:hypothetical protein
MDWRKIPLVCAFISVATGLKILAEKQMETVFKMQDSIQLLEAIRLPKEPAGVVQETQEPEQVKPAEKQAPVAQKSLVMHSMTPCIYCRTDKAKIIPIWIAKGYNVTYVDDGRGVPGQHYPWYEITDETGNKKIHVGTLGAFR